MFNYVIKLTMDPKLLIKSNLEEINTITNYLLFPNI